MAPDGFSDGRLKILFVCAMNKQRSATAETMYRNDARLSVRSAGTRHDARRRVTEADLKWADVVFAMEREHKLWIETHYEHLDLPRIDVLHVPDEFPYMDEGLQEMLSEMLEPEITHLIASRNEESGR